VRRLEDLGTRGPLDASAGRGSAYACLFGRDSLRMALDLLDDFPAVARSTIRRLTALQGVRWQARSEEEPGRIVHEHRRGCDPFWASLTRCWDLPYYGAVDTTPLYVVLIGAYCEQWGRSILAEPVRHRLGGLLSVGDGLQRALGWIEQRLAQQGYVCVWRAQPHGIQNQVWQDSFDSQFLSDGRLFDPDVPYAPVDVQGLAFDALLVGAALTSDAQQAARWRALASRLRQRVLAKLWLPSLGTFAPALVLDEAGGPVAPGVVASNPGHLLATRLLDGEDVAEQRAALVRRLLAPDMLAGAGIRTKSTTAPRFAAGSYHNGSVWPMDTGIIADGLRRHGYLHAAADLEERLLRACVAVGGPVEFFRGDVDGSVRVNTCIVDGMRDGHYVRFEQPPQAVQGWTATRLWRILRARGWRAQDTTPRQPAQLAA
jgi:glycogen debranching enzyme